MHLNKLHTMLTEAAKDKSIARRLGISQDTAKKMLESMSQGKLKK